MEKIKMNQTYVQGVEQLQTLSKDLNQLVLDINSVSKKIKTYEEEKNKLRSKFFSLVDEYIKISGTAEREVLTVKFASRAEAEVYVEDNHPGWVIVQYEDGKTVIEEDPSQMRFTWTTEDGYQINRTTAIVGTRFDFDRFRETHPDIFDSIVEVKTVYELNEKKAQKLIEEHPEYLPDLQSSTKLGKIQLRMSSPKKVVDE
jgi:ElaB/YqjD/DUF883 family membrane-anchored ribosome-binding protein